MTQIQFDIPGKAMVIIEGSEISMDPVKYDGGSEGAHDAFLALTLCTRRRVGKGYSYRVIATEAGAETILDYCSTVGEGFSYETEQEIRADGRVLLLTAGRIRAAALERGVTL